MRRIHSIEFHDQPWFPAPLRDHLTGFLTEVSIRFGVYASIVPRLATLVRDSGATRVVDLCSGAGGPARWTHAQMLEHEGIDCALTPTDKFPNTGAWEAAGLNGHPEPVDALDVPPDLDGVRTMFAAFHHFRPDDARRILQDAVDKGAPFAIFEGTRRTIPWILVTAMSWINLLLLTPLIRPVRLSGLVFTYLIPILPFVCVWDGVVSCLRTYTPAELEAMCAELEGTEGWTF